MDLGGYSRVRVRVRVRPGELTAGSGDDDGDGSEAAGEPAWLCIKLGWGIG